jgi:quercetin dioxygenase-like cupin family protein
MRSTLMMFALCCGAFACRDEVSGPAPAVREAPTTVPASNPAMEPGTSPGARVTRAPTRSADQPAMMRPEVDIAAPIVLGLDQIKWMPGPPSLPNGAQVAVLEGAPPFPADRTFTVAVKLPKNYMIPPHTHLVTERVTVLKGTLSFGHGEKADRKAATRVKAGGLVLIPADHTHYAFTTNEESVITLNGVGPWEIIYVDPKDDPRSTPVRKPDTMVSSRWEAPAEAKIIQAADVKFETPPPGMLHEGAKIAVLEGDPNEPKMFTLRLQFPKGHKIRPHSHSVTERFMVVGGSASFGFGDTQSDKAMNRLAMGAVGVVPKGQPHYAQASNNGVVVQVTGVGPFDMNWAHAEDAPAK